MISDRLVNGWLPKLPKCLSIALKSVGKHQEPMKKVVRLRVRSVGKKRWKKFHEPLEKIATRWNFCAPVESVG